jgi:hypothetical protein
MSSSCGGTSMSAAAGASASGGAPGPRLSPPRRALPVFLTLFIVFFFVAMCFDSLKGLGEQLGD